MRCCRSLYVWSEVRASDLMWSQLTSLPHHHLLLQYNYHVSAFRLTQVVLEQRPLSVCLLFSVYLSNSLLTCCALFSGVYNQQVLSS